MRFILNEFPEDKNFEPGEEWTPLKESTNLWIIQLQALPFMILNLVIMLVIMSLIGISFVFNVRNMLIAFIIFMPIHEFIHALFFPANLKSHEVYFGFTFKGLAFYAAYTGTLTKRQFIRSLLAPLIIISLIGFIILLIFGSNSIIEHIILLNALGACGDCLGALLILYQTPKDALLKNKKIRTYWKKDNCISS